MSQSEVEKYAAANCRLIESIGIKLADRVTRFIRHFYFTPNLQIIGYIVEFFKDEGLSKEHISLVAKIVVMKEMLWHETDHAIATEIDKKALMVPSYCLSSELTVCKICGTSLKF